jgi:hypothetical protein
VPRLDKTWYVRTLRALLDRVLFDAARTQVIVTTCDDALAAAVEEVFPEAFHHLCETSVIQQIKGSLEYPMRWYIDDYMKAWKSAVLECPTVDSLPSRPVISPSRASRDQ